MTLSINNIKKSIYVFIFTVMITFFIDTVLRVEFYYFSNSLRLIDHLIVAFSFILIFYLLFNKLVFPSILYFIISLNWEYSQFLERNYFQYDQLLFDVLGILFGLIFLNKK